MSCDKVRPLIGPYRDGELSSLERRAVADHVSTCAACSQAMDDDANLARHIAEGGAIHIPVDLQQRVLAALDSEDLRAAAANTVQVSPRRFVMPRSWLRAAAVLLACVLSATGGWQLAQTPQRTNQLAQDVLQAHVRALVQDNPIQVASSDSHTVKPWFAGRVDVSPSVKDLSPQGFPLIGGRLDYIADKRVGVVVYKRNAHWINVYMWPVKGEPDSAPLLSSRNGYNLLTWTQNGITSWAVSDLNPTELRQLQALL
jgi:anti-sigma factor RsiW